MINETGAHSAQTPVASAKDGSARARRCFRCARACPLHWKGANSTGIREMSVKWRSPAQDQLRPARADGGLPHRTNRCIIAIRGILVKWLAAICVR
jgi:hypothetical protein